MTYLILGILLSVTSVSRAETVEEILLRVQRETLEKARQIDEAQGAFYRDLNAREARERQQKVDFENAQADYELARKHYQENLFQNSGRRSFTPPPPRPPQILENHYLERPLPQQTIQSAQNNRNFLTSGLRIEIERGNDNAVCVAIPIGENLLLTARHCTGGSPRHVYFNKDRSEKVVTHPDSTLPPPAQDLAIVSFSSPLFSALTKVGRTKTGASVRTLLRAGASDTQVLDVAAMGRDRSVPTHYVTKKVGENYEDSGSPLLNEFGEVVGVLSGCYEDRDKCFYFMTLGTGGRAVFEEAGIAVPN